MIDEGFLVKVGTKQTIIVDKNGSNLEEAATDMVVEENPKKTEEKILIITVCENEKNKSQFLQLWKEIISVWIYLELFF